MLVNKLALWWLNNMNNQTAPLSAAIVPVTPLQQNCTIIWCTKTMKAMVIDPGGDVEAIMEAISETGVKPEKIVLTHGHIDHAGGAGELKEKLGIDIVGPHEDDLFLLESLEETGAMYGVANARNCTSDNWLKDGDVLKVGEVEFAVRHCPGHSPGSVVFINEAMKLAIVGDVLFAGSIGRTDLPRGNHDDLISSIKEKLLSLDDDVTFICGHGPTSTIGAERAGNPFLQG
jgi:glyoxylase-like metal-dependent hydrolase (beta-lactamase superfamily II)